MSNPAISVRDILPMQAPEAFACKPRNTFQGKATPAQGGAMFVAWDST
jgi:hypothetical protein